MTLQHRITAALESQKGATQAGLARACGIQRASVHAWVHGPTDSIDGKYLTTAADYLGVDPHWLATGQGEMKASKPRHVGALWKDADYSRPSLVNLRQVPVIGTTQGGFPDRVWTDGDLPVGGGEEYADCKKNVSLA
jgi:transcriptional regulator with XRE-family HTH domain